MSASFEGPLKIRNLKTSVHALNSCEFLIKAVWNKISQESYWRLYLAAP
jgi:hypothetical protein